MPLGHFFEGKQQLGIAFCIVLGAFWTTKERCVLPPPHTAMEGIGYFHIHAVKQQSSFFSKSLVYEGELKSFFSKEKGQYYYKIPCRVFVAGKKRPKADCDYLIKGRLSSKNFSCYSLKPCKKTPWQRIPNSISFAEMRWQIKTNVKKVLRSKISDPEIFSFFSLLATGESPNLLLPHYFRQVGLSHLLVISGFHFALLSLCWGFALRLFLPKQIAYFLLLLLLVLYELYLGPSPSSERASLAIYIFLFGILIGRKASPLNTLGMALLVQLAYRPLLLFHIGFQLSYAATFAIFLFYPYVEKKLFFLLPKREFQVLKKGSILDRHLFLACSWIRKQIALLIAVHLFTLPLILYYFFDFPLLSFVYNLYAAPLVSLCFIFLLFAFFPLLSFFILPMLLPLARFTLNIIIYAPKALDFHFRTQKISSCFLTALMTALLLFGLMVYEKNEEKIL
ncbi:MAG: hypothetical protein Tsb0015_00080 [Simkaniaceae bacterium]